MKTKNQKQLILEHLTKGEKLTKMFMITKLGIINAGEVIRKLRKEHCIEKRFVKNQTSGKRYAEYFMPENLF
jgi:hypothetical protein